MKFINSRKLKKYNRKHLLNQLDEAKIPIKSSCAITHLERLINYDFSDDEIMIFMKRYSELDKRRITSHDKETYIFLYGEIKGNELFNEYSKRNSESGKLTYKNGRKAVFEHFFPEYWIKNGYSISEANAIVAARKAKAAECAKLAFKSRGLYHNTQIEYYLNKGYTVVEAKNKLAERQNTRSLKSFKMRYGNDLGAKKYNECNVKWQKTLNEKSDDEKRRIYEARIAGFQKVSSPACISKKRNINIKFD